MNVVPRASAAMEWNKRTYEDDSLLNSQSPKRPRYSFHVRLESESSVTSEGEESTLTVQDLETEVVQDTADTDSKSEDSDFDVFEYEVASLSESDQGVEDHLSTSSGCSNVVPVVDIEEIVVVLNDSTLEAWASDSEHSSTDDMDDSINAFYKTDFSTCAQCKEKNDVPRFRLCTSCFQHRTCWCCKMRKDNNYFPLCSTCFKVRKKFYPPRPRRTRKQRTPDPAPSTSSTDTLPVNIEKLKSCLDGISQEFGFAPSTQDSGLGSSQELPLLQLDKIVIPETAIGETKKRRRSQDSDEYFVPKTTKLDVQEIKEGEPSRSSLPDIKEMCIICNERSKNSAFVHGNSAHACCCYRCAIRCWKSHKKCPICNRKIKNVLKLFTM